MILQMVGVKKVRFKHFIIFFCVFYYFAKNLNTAYTSPSQAVTKVFENIEKKINNVIVKNS